MRDAIRTGLSVGNEHEFAEEALAQYGALSLARILQFVFTGDVDCEVASAHEMGQSGERHAEVRRVEHAHELVVDVLAPGDAVVLEAHLWAVLPDTDHPRAGRSHLRIELEIVVEAVVEDYVDAVGSADSAGRLSHRAGEVRTGVVEDPVGTQLGESVVVVRAGGRQHLCASRGGELNCHVANATASSVNQTGFTGFETRMVDERAPRRHADDARRSCHLRIHTVGQGDESVSRHGRALGVAAVMVAADTRPVDVVAGRESFGFVAGLAHFAGEIGPRNHRQRERLVRSFSKVGIDGVDASGMDVDEYLTSAGTRLVDLLDVQYLGTAVVVESDGAHGDHSSRSEKKLSRPVRAFIGGVEPTPMRLIAHRGFADRYPENTLVAIEKAVDDADMIELDVRRCGSGELVVFHDEVVDRATDGSGRVDDLPLGRLADLDVHGTGTGIPSLAEAADTIPADTGINLELKERGIANEAVAAASTVDNEVIVSSFDGQALDDLDTDDSTVELAYLFGLNTDEDFESALELDCAYIHPHWSHWLLTDAVERAHDAGMKVNVWTIDTAIGTGLLSRAGVDGVIADSPDVL